MKKAKSLLSTMTYIHSECSHIFKIIYLLILLLIGCKSSNLPKSGDQAYDSGQFWRAKELYKIELQKSNKIFYKEKIYHNLALCYELSHQPDSALIWHQLSEKLASNPEKRNSLALAYKNCGKYVEAKNIWLELQNELKVPNQFIVDIKSCELALEMKSRIDKNNVIVKKLVDDFNHSIYDPEILNDSILVVTADKLESNDALYYWTGRGFSSLVSFNLKKNTYEAYENFNIKGENIGSLHFSDDKKQLVFCKCYNINQEIDQKCKIYYSKFLNKEWSEPEMLLFQVDSLNYISPSFFGNTSIYFSAQNPANDQSFDIFYVKKSAEGYVDPIILSSPINTLNDEKFPYWHLDTLYFSSLRSTGLGGLDIYKVFKIGEKWSIPSLLEMPINSSFDDFGFKISAFIPDSNTIESKGYFTSNRDNKNGLDQIIEFKKLKKIVIDTIPKLDEIKQIVKINVYVSGFILENEKINLRITKPLQDAMLSGKDYSMNTNHLGIATLELPLMDLVDFKMAASKDGYLSTSKNIIIKNLNLDTILKWQEVNIAFDLYPKVYNQEISIKDIYYDYDKYEIRKDALKSLDDLLAILKLNSDISIIISSHTDCRGSEKYNQSLSTKRSLSVLSYFINQGVSKNRLRSIGMGESKLIEICECEKCNDVQHQVNRRTTFQLVK